MSSSPDGPYLPQALAAWGSADFAEAFRREVAALGEAHLPLQQSLAHGSRVASAPLTVLVRNAEDRGASIYVQADVLFRSVIAGCSCADDPTPDSDLAECAALQVAIDKASGRAVIALRE